VKSIAELNQHHGIRGIASIVEGNAHLPKIRITAPSASGEMYLHGAHVTSWRPAGQKEVLFLSPRSLYQDGIAIRGGVPICFPWFGDKTDDPQAPAHGFVRTKTWQLESIEHKRDVVTVKMFTESSNNTKKWWPSDFRLSYRASFGTELALEMIVTNIGDTPLHFEEALHAYYSVGDVTKASLAGLDGTQYLDKTDSFREKPQQGEVVITGETDRVYLNTEGKLYLSDPVLQRRTIVIKENSRSTVVWNPWSVKTAAMKDLGADEWKSMLCVEVANVGDAAISLAPGEQHTMRARVRVGS
jgi:glucose-6-phosphate 1-epimerase